MLYKNNRFQEDIDRYQKAIDKITNNQEKLEMQRLLNDLVYQVKNVDNMFLDMVYAKQLPSMGNEFRENIASIRKKLEEKLFQKKQ